MHLEVRSKSVIVSGSRNIRVRISLFVPTVKDISVLVVGAHGRTEIQFRKVIYLSSHRIGEVESDVEILVYLEVVLDTSVYDRIGVAKIDDIVLIEIAVAVYIHVFSSSDIAAVRTILDVGHIGMGVLITVYFLLTVPYSGILIPPEGIHRIACLIAIHVLGACARIHVCRHDLISGAGVRNLLSVVGNRECRPPLEVLFLYVL